VDHNPFHRLPIDAGRSIPDNIEEILEHSAINRLGPEFPYRSTLEAVGGKLLRRYVGFARNFRDIIQGRVINGYRIFGARGFAMTAPDAYRFELIGDVREPGLNVLSDYLCGT
jgi:hypothetical protein